MVFGRIRSGRDPKGRAAAILAAILGLRSFLQDCTSTGAMSDQRQLYRVAIDRTGQVRRGDQAYSCHVIDLTEHGVRLQLNGTFLAGDELQLEFALTDVDLLACTIQVTNRRPPYIGATIVQM